MEGKHQSLAYRAMDSSFSFRRAIDTKPDPAQYLRHYETGYELFFFISGEGRYNIEGTLYKLEPYSLLMMNAKELHALEISDCRPYERIVITIRKNFLPPFLTHGVDFFRSIKFRKLGQGNQIRAELVAKSGLLDMMERLQALLERPAGAENELLAKCVIVEMLGAINTVKESGQGNSSPRPAASKVTELLEYINGNLNEPLGLDALAERFYLTKYHLCHIFKEATGYSINQYISYKRIHMADGLMQDGYTPTQACFMSGFNSYSSFYKAYRKLTGHSPRRGEE